MFGTIPADPDVLYKPSCFRDLPIQELLKYPRPRFRILLLLVLWLLHLSVQYLHMTTTLL